MTNELMENGGNPPENFQNPVAPKRASGWTPERRARQAEWMRENRPWRNATGPRSAAGKRRAGQNAYKHGFRSQDFQELVRLLRQQRRFVAEALSMNIPPPPIHGRGRQRGRG